VTTPWWDEPHEGVITKKFHTPVENYYVITFPDGEVITMKESEIENPELKQTKDYLYYLHIPNFNKQEVALGYVLALWNRNHISYHEYCILKDWVFENIPKKGGLDGRTC